jgi:hypothetical protein
MQRVLDQLTAALALILLAMYVGGALAAPATLADPAAPQVSVSEAEMIAEAAAWKADKRCTIL